MNLLKAAAGQLELHAAMPEGELRAAVMRPVAPGSDGATVVESSWREVTVDARDASEDIRIADTESHWVDYDAVRWFEIAVPLEAVGLRSLEPDTTLRADFGVLWPVKGNRGFRAAHPVAWADRGGSRVLDPAGRAFPHGSANLGRMHRWTAERF